MAGAPGEGRIPARHFQLMKRILPYLLLGIVGGFAAWWLQRTFLSEEARIRRTITHLLADASFPRGTGNIAKTAKFNALGSHFTDDITINIEQIVPAAIPLSGRDELQHAAQVIFTQFKFCEVTLHDVAAGSMEADHRTARAAFTASATTDRTGLEFSAQEFEVQLRKNTEGRWQIFKITAVLTLKR